MKEVWYFQAVNLSKENYVLPVTGERVVYRSTEGEISFFSYRVLPRTSPSYKRLNVLPIT